jgi:hypothetical protein
MSTDGINPKVRYIVPMLRITQCPDPLRWYAGKVGHLVPQRGELAHFGMDEYLSNEPDGSTNFVQAADCQRVKVSVSGRKLTEWPYAPVASQARLATDRFDGEVFVTDFAGPVIGLPRKTCAHSCNAMGICQALDDCQDKPRIDAELARKGAKPPAPKPSARYETAGIFPSGAPRFALRHPDGQFVFTEFPEPTPTGQSRAHSMAEAVANIAVGFLVSVVITAWLLPAMGHQVSLSENVLMTSVFTVASLLRSFAIRRAFNHLHTRAHP